VKSGIVFRLFFVAIVAVAFIAIGTASLDDFPVQRKVGSVVSPKPTVFHSPSPTATPTPYSSAQAFQTGMVYPRWNTDGYGSKDTGWQQSMSSLHEQTGAAWIEMPLVFSQAENANSFFDHVTPSLATFTAGVKAAHAHGYHIFLIPLLTTRATGGWANLITFDTTVQEQTWFTAFEKLYTPYIEVAQQNRVEQLSLGTEAGWLQNNGQTDLWERYIAQVRALFSGKVTYDTNWGNLEDNPPSWFSSLDYIGVSEYIPIISSGYRVDPAQMGALWASTVGEQLDLYAARVHKMLIISEIGYRDSTDSFFEPWRQTSTTAEDQSEQAGAVNAALSYVAKDELIHGTFFWGWDDVGAFSLKNTEAARTIKTWYTQLNLN